MTLETFKRAADIIWDTANRKIYETFLAKSGDSAGRKMRVQILNRGVIEDLTGTSLNLGWKTKDGMHKGLDAFVAIDITKGIFEITYTTGMLSNIGKLDAVLQLVDAVGVIESDNFTITVTKSPIDADSIQSSDSFGTLEAALVAVQGTVADINTLKATTDTLDTGYDGLTVQLGMLQTAVNAIDRGYGGTYASLAALTAAIPAGDTNRYITTDNGHWNYWSGAAWVSGGVFQATAMPVGVKTVSEFATLLKGAVEGTELMTNGSNFVSTTGWSPFSATQAVSGGYLVITGTGSGYSGSNFNIGAADAPGTKYYYRYTMRVRNAGCQKIGIRSSSTAVANTEIANPVQDQWYTKSGGFTKTAAQGSATNMSPSQYYANTSGMILEVAEVNAINLTALYGAGLEPSYDDFAMLFDTWLADYLEAASTFDETIAKLEKATEGTNMITNGENFVNTSGWTAFQATQAVAGGLLVLTGSVVASYSGSNFDVGIGSPTGSKFFYQYKARVRDAGCQKISIRSSNAEVTSMAIANPVQDVWYTKSGGFTKTAAIDAATNVYPCQFYDSANMVGKVLEVERIAAVDLTALYGSGSEPSYDDFALIYNNWLSAYLQSEKARVDSALPEVVDMTEFNAIQTEVFSKQTTQSMDYVMITDNHLIDSIYETGLVRLQKAIDLANRRFVDFLLIGGDLICTAGYTEPIATSRDKMLAVRDMLATSKVPVIVLHGNHDDNSTTQFLHTAAEHYSQEDFYKTLIRPFEMGQGFIHDTQKPASTYYYKDFPIKKMRLIVLDGCDYPVMDDGTGHFKYRGADWFGYGARQTTWVGTEALVGIPAGYKVVVLSHCPVGSSFINGSLIEGQITACHNGTTYTGSNANADYGVSVNVNYMAQGARQVLLFHHGHNHNDGISLRDTAWNMVCTSWAGGGDVFDVTTIDGESNKLWFTRVGTVGVDRVITI